MRNKRQKIIDIAKKWSIPPIKETVKIKDDKYKFVYKIICIDHTEYLFKSRNNVEKIGTEEELLLYIDNNKIPTSIPLRTKDDCLFVPYQNKYYVLYKFINGNHIRCKSIQEYKDAIQIYGSIIGRFHRVLKSYNGKSENISDMNLSSQIFDWALPILEKQSKYTKIRKVISEIKDDMLERNFQKCTRNEFFENFKTTRPRLVGSRKQTIVSV